MLVPAYTGSGASLFVMERSADATTCVVTDVEIVESRPPTVVSKNAWFVMLPAGFAGSTFTTSVKTADDEAAIPGALHVIVDVPEHDHPPGGVIDTNVVDGGSVSRMAAASRSTVPLFDAVIV